MQDYNKQPIAVGDTVKNIESGWRGRIESTEGEGRDLMLVCLGINWWTGEVDEDDKQWHSPFDVIKCRRQAPERHEAPAPGNFL
jgi:hypothetical protein